MKIEAIEARLVRIPLKRPVTHASHRRTETDNVVVKVTLANGVTGYGEGVPREYVTGETAESALAVLGQSQLKSQLSEGCDTFENAVRHAERFTLANSPGDDRRCQSHAARCAVELAFLDAYGKHFGEPLMSVTKLLAPSLYEPKAEIRYSTAILSATGLKASLKAFAMRWYGFRDLKVKVGIAGQDDVAKLRAIHRGAGARIRIRIDANEAWTADEALAKIQALAPFGIQSVEQPLPHEAFTALTSLSAASPVPIMLDESLCGMVDAQHAVATNACKLFNLRLSKCGGFIRTLRLAEMAYHHGMGCQLGCQVGETAILSAAGRHFATSVSGLKFLEGSFDRHLVKEALATDDITFGRGGRAPMLTGSGLGITVDTARLDTVTLRTESLS
jgi:muconate cycloisomerase